MPVFAVTAGRDREELITGGEDNSIVWWNWTSGNIVHRWEKAHTSSVTKVVYSDAQDRLLSGSRDRTIKVWQRAEPDPQVVLQGHELIVSGLDINEGGTVAASGSRDCTVRVWDIAAGRELRSKHRDSNLTTDLRWIPDENVFLQSSEDLRLRVWDTNSLEVVQTFEGLVNLPRGCAVSPDGRYFMTSHNGFDINACELKVFDRRQGKMMYEVHGHTGVVNACVFATSQTGEMQLVSASGDGTIRVWDFQTGDVLTTEPVPVSEGVLGLAIPHGEGPTEHIYSASFNGGVHVWHLGAEGRLTCAATSS